MGFPYRSKVVGRLGVGALAIRIVLAAIEVAPAALVARISIVVIVVVCKHLLGSELVGLPSLVSSLTA